MSTIIGFFCAATAFPLMLFERVFPYRPEPERIEWEDDKTWYHNYKNIWTESVRADSQWYGKMLAFLAVVGWVS